MVNRIFAGFLLMVVTVVGASGELPTPNKFGGDFSFPSTEGGRLQISTLKGKVVILNFGFTSCPDVCPMVLAKLAAVQKQLDSRGQDLQVIFVTVDPERDSLDKMKQYLPKFHASFIGLRGDTYAEVKAVLKSYGGYVNAVSGNEGESEITHTDYVYIIDRKGYVSGFYDVKGSYSELMEAIEKVM